jgi:hypothetical protein
MRTFILVVACASQLAAQPSDTSNADRARAVVMRHVEAIGGLEALNAVQSVHMTASMRLPYGIDMRTETWRTKPNFVYGKAWNQYSVSEGGFDGKVFWSLSNEEGAKIHSRMPEVLGAAAAIDPLHSLSLYDVKYVGLRDRSGRKMETLQMTGPDGVLYTQYFDAETGLFARLEVGDPSAPTSLMRIEKYKKFGTLMYATVLTTKVLDGGETVARVTSVDHKPIDPKRYELPKAVRDIAVRKP